MRKHTSFMFLAMTTMLLCCLPAASCSPIGPAVVGGIAAAISGPKDDKPAPQNTPPGKTANPLPSNNEPGAPATSDLAWSAGTGAGSYDVYLGTVLSAVTDATSASPEFRGSQAGLGFDPGALSYSATYYWRVDSVNAFGTTKGDVWQFTVEDTPSTAPDKVTGPVPANSSTGIPTGQILGWNAAGGAQSYDVYFGTDQALVTAANNGSLQFAGNQGALNYDPPGQLVYETAYYWRVDSVNTIGTTKGDTWSFGTIPAPPVADFSATPLSGMVPLYVDFSDESTGGVTSWRWDFDNNGTTDSTLQDPSYTFNSPGVYTVKLSVTSSTGSDEEIKSDFITVLALPLDTVYISSTGSDATGDGTPANPYGSIQKGIDCASSGDVIVVGDGTYTGSANKDINFNGKSIHLKSASLYSKCTIDCEDSGRAFNFDDMEDYEAIVEGFTIMNGDPGEFEDGGAIRCYLSSPTISRCVITSNKASDGAGIHCTGSTSLIINCVIVDNISRGHGAGIALCSSDAEIINCTIANNSAGGSCGGILVENCDPVMKNSIVWGNFGVTEAHQILILNVATLTVNCCDYADNSLDPDNIGYPAKLTEVGTCIHLDPTFINAGSGDYRLLDSSPCEEAGDNSLVPDRVMLDAEGYMRIWDSDNDGIPVVEMGAFEESSGPPNPEYHWTRTIGGNGMDQVWDMCTDASGNLYMVGHHSSDTIDFMADWGGIDPKTLTGGDDAFIMKVKADDSYNWTHMLSGGGLEWAKAVCADSAGNIYVAGIFDGTLNFGADFGTSDTKTSNGGADVFAMRINVNNTYGWTGTAGGTSSDYANDICCDGSGNVYVVGEYTGLVDFGEEWSISDPKTTLASSGAFAMKLTSTGGYCWTHVMEATGQDVAKACCTDGSGNVYVAGEFDYTIDFAEDWGGSDPVSPASEGVTNVFLTKIDSAGGYCWTRRFGGGAESCFVEACCTDSGGNVFLAGAFAEPVNFAQSWGGSETKTPDGLTDVFVTKVDSAGGYCWTRRYGGTGAESPWDMSVNTFGDIYICGFFEGTVNFAADWSLSEDKASAGGIDAFITRIRYTDSYGKTNTAGGAGEDWACAVCADPLRNVYLGGYFTNNGVNFGLDWGGNDVKTNAGQQDIFVTKLTYEE